MKLNKFVRIFNIGLNDLFLDFIIMGTSGKVYVFTEDMTKEEIQDKLDLLFNNHLPLDIASDFSNRKCKYRNRKQLKSNLVLKNNLDDDSEYVINSSHDPINSSFRIFEDGDSEDEMLRKLNELQEKIKRTSNF